MTAEKRVELSARLLALAGMVTPGTRICDVGCDHGFLSVYLVQEGICPGAVAMDVRRGPLSRAQEHVAEYGLSAYITVRLSDGLRELMPGEADAMVCAGMGGPLMARILTEGADKAVGFRELILQPQSELEEFRIFLRRQGYRTVAEHMIEEDGKYYPMMKVVPTGEAIPCGEPLFDKYGELLLRERNPVLRRYLCWRKSVVSGIREQVAASGKESSRGRLAEVETELAQIDCALAWFG